MVEALLTGVTDLGLPTADGHLPLRTPEDPWVYTGGGGAAGGRQKYPLQIGVVSRVVIIFLAVRPKFWIS